MKYSQMFFLISVMFVLGSFFKDEAYLLLLIISFISMAVGIWIGFLEDKLMELQHKHFVADFNLGVSKFHLIITLLESIDKKLGGKNEQK